MPSSPVLARHLLVRLQHDWERIKWSKRSVDQARRWQLTTTSSTSSRPLQSLDDVLAWTGYGSVDADDDGDQVLRQLVRLAASDQLAARVVLQRLLPGISAMARRRAGAERSHLQALDDVLTSAWTVICTYPIDRRNTYVAAGLLREIDYHAFKRAHRRLATFIARPAHAFEGRAAAEPISSAADELRELLDAAAAAGLDAADIELARRLGRGESTRQIAQSCHVTDRTVRNHRQAVAYRLRAVALAAH